MVDRWNCWLGCRLTTLTAVEQIFSAFKMLVNWTGDTDLLAYVQTPGSTAQQKDGTSEHQLWTIGNHAVILQLQCNPSLLDRVSTLNSNFCRGSRFAFHPE